MRLLVVEDDPDICAFLAQGFRAEYFEVDTAANGIEGSYLARSNDYDLIVLDNILPGRTGIQVCRDIRDRGRGVPILLLSVVVDPAVKVEFLNAGADDYVSKPFLFQEVLARVRALLRRPPASSAGVLLFSDILLDPARHMVTRGDRLIRLTRKEFQLLEYLMRNPGKVLSRASIVEHVWDMYSDPFSNTLETHILNLRRKLDRGLTSTLIHTIPGYGYKIDLRK